MKNNNYIKKAKQIVLILVLSFLSLNIIAQNPPKLYPYGDEFPLGLYSLSKQFNDVKSKHWNNGHIYRSYTYIDANGDTAISYASLNGYITNPKAPIPQIYFDTCKANNMCAKGRISTIENDTTKVHSPVANSIIEAEINQQSVNTNLSWWDLPEEMRVQPNYIGSEDTILARYARKTREYDPSQRPNYMYTAGHLFQEQMVHYVADLDIMPVSCYPEYGYINYTWPAPRGLPHSYVRWAIERTQKAITEPSVNNSGTKIGKDYLNGEKTITVVLEMFRNTALVTIETFDSLPAIDSTGTLIDTLRLKNLTLSGDTIIKIKNFGIAPWSNAYTNPQSHKVDVSAYGWKIKDNIFDHEVESQHTWHDFWLALACDVQGIEVFSHFYAVKGPGFYGHLGAPWQKLNDAVAVFKANDLDKVQLNGIMDTSLNFNILSGPDSTEFFRYEPSFKSPRAFVDIQYPSIKLQAKKWMGDTYIIAVNSTDSTVVYDIPIQTTAYNLAYENLITNQSRNWTEDAIHPPGYINTLHIIDTLPPLGVSVFKYKSSTSLDLSMRDCLNDNGYDAGYRKDLEDIDNSPDIWVRRTNDFGTIHQAPKYDLNTNDTTNYVYVRIKNISEEASSGNEILKLYWTKNGMSPLWPDVWDGSHPDPTMGGLVAFQTIPVLQEGEEVILEFEWNVVKDRDTIGGTDWGHCLLARIENTNGKDEIQDFFNSNGDHNLSKEVFNNNNISLRNCEIIVVPTSADIFSKHHQITKTLDLGNSSNIGDFYDITFQVPKFFRTSSITDNATVNVKFDAQGWNIFQNSINNTTGANISGEREITLTEHEITFENIYIPANTTLPTTLIFDFLIQNDSTAEYEFLVSSQTSIADSDGDYWRSNVRYVVKTNPRDPFDADAGDDREINAGESTMLCAELINEAATYNWYDMEGNLIYTGTDFIVSPEVSERYRLEVIAAVDGLTCYDEVDVEVNPYFIISINPNPAIYNTIIEYVAEGANSAFISLVNNQTASAHNFVINPNQQQTTINVANLPTGVYTAILVCDGVSYGGSNLVVY